MLVAVFTGLVLISNVTATKGIAFGPIIGDWSIITDGGFIVFPMTYVIGDVLSEVYGFAATRRAIFIAFVMEALAALAFWVTALLPAADFYTNQAAFEAVVKPFTQLIIAGLAGFIVGQTVNAWVVVRIKARTKEKHLWARLVGSTIVGEFADTIVFCSIAAGAIGINTWRRLRHLRRAGLAVQDLGGGHRAARHLPGDRIPQTPRAYIPTADLMHS